MNEHALQNIIGEAPAFLEMLEHVSEVAPLTKPVLVVGERGTGKELIASRLHFLSARWEQALIKVNCAAFTESILESELFGHEAGAFTGANRTHQGHFERASGGTLILDELATISLRMQEKILRVIEYGEIRRVGGSKSIAVDTRIVASTNADLPAKVAKGEFRPDLLDRLAFDVITIPPLRHRKEDVLTLANSFAINMASELKHSHFSGFSQTAQALLMSYSWPGNVRELKNAVERSVYRAGESEHAVEQIVLDPFDSPYRLTDSNSETVTELPTKKSNPDTAIDWPINLDQHIANIEQHLIEQALKTSHFRQSDAAALLELSYHQFRGRLKKYAIEL